MRCLSRPEFHFASFAMAAVLLVSSAAIGQSDTRDDATPWWPAGESAAADATATAQPATAPPVTPASPAAAAPAAAAETEPGGWMATTPFGNVGWPEIKMPKMQWKNPLAGQADPATGQPAAGFNPMARVRKMTQGAAQRTRTAWNNTVERFKFGTGDQSPTVEKEPGFFARMFGPGPPEGGAETVPEFLAQERPGGLQR